MKAIKKIIAVAMVLTMVLAAGCSVGDTSWVYKTEATTMPAGQYIAYELEAMSLFMNEIAKEYAEQEDFEAPTNFQELLKLEVGGVKGSDWVEAEAQKNARAYFGLMEECTRLGLSISPEEEAMIDMQVSSSWETNKEPYENSGVSKESWMLYQKDTYLRNQLFVALYEADGEQEVTEEELKNVFLEKYKQADIVQIEKHQHVEGEEETVEKTPEEVAAHAEAYRKRLDAGETPEALMEALAKEGLPEEQQALVMPMEAGSLTLTVSEADGYQFRDNLVKAILEAKDSTAFVHEVDEYIYIIKTKDLSKDEMAFLKARSYLLSDLKTDDFAAHLNTVADGLSVKENAGALRRYKAENIKDLETQQY